MMCLFFRFNAQNKEVRFGNFIFGPVVMRMFHYLKDVDLAINVYKTCLALHTFRIYLKSTLFLVFQRSRIGRFLRSID